MSPHLADLAEGLSAFMLPYAEAGHDVDSVFAAPSYKCSRCGSYLIDLSEDLAYGPMRECEAVRNHLISQGKEKSDG